MSINFESIKEQILNKPDFKYEGLMDWDTMKTVIKQVEDMINETNDSLSFQRKAFHVLVELLQNAYRHKLEEGIVDLFIQVRDGMFYILVQNEILQDEVPYFSNKIDTINELSTEELKSLQMEQLTTRKSKRFEDIGLGLLSIRRKVKHQLFYQFEENDEQSVIVSLIAVLDV